MSRRHLSWTQAPQRVKQRSPRTFGSTAEGIRPSKRELHQQSQQRRAALQTHAWITALEQQLRRENEAFALAASAIGLLALSPVRY